MVVGEGQKRKPVLKVKVLLILPCMWKEVKMRRVGAWEHG